MPATKLNKTAVKTILVIEDEGDMCLLIDLILNSKEISINHVKSLNAAKEYLQTEQPALILLDNRLPDGLGLDFIAFIKKNYPAIKIIMISGVDLAAQDIALENGADNFLAKPFTRAQLHASIRELLN
jgi:two-component system OmpR family response regulator